ncbi:hypothetical protein FB451DRAFT_1413544 [Mycena latifolia]|nr:hypothetical protein FB451DRAFT_1413544 [Mycena latifolia]
MSSNVDETVVLLQLVEDSRLTGCLAVASLCVLIYDHLICFGEEVELMWQSQWGLAKIIYLWNRHFSLVFISLATSAMLREMTTDNAYVWKISCTDWLKLQCVTSTVVIGTVDFVLMLRVWILYGRPRVLVWLFAITVGFFAFAEISEYVHLGWADISPLENNFLIADRPSLKGCYAYNVPRFLALSAAAPVFVTFIMFVLTVYKCCATLQGDIQHYMPVWRLFLRDGVVWFTVVLVAAGTELLIWGMRRDALKQLLVVPALVVYSTVASRALLNIKAIMATSDPQLETFPEVPIAFVSV